MMLSKCVGIGISAVIALFGAYACTAASLPQDRIVAGTVIDVRIPENDPLRNDFVIQNIQVRLQDARTIVEVVNDFTPLARGDRIFLRAMTDEEGVTYALYDRDRTRPLLILMGIFFAAVALFGGWKGVRALIALGGSLVILCMILVPALRAGHAPLVWGIGVAIGILALAMLGTHGWRIQTLTAFLGTSGAVAIAGLLAWGSMHILDFTGIGTEEAFYLSTLGLSVDMADLLLAGIVIGMLGVLDDVAITQAAVVQELYGAGLRGWQLYWRAMHIGREHVGALINTLVLAYVGTSLPLLILLSTYAEPMRALMSSEMVATEIVRSVVGSIGLVTAVPLTTALAAWFAHRGYVSGHTEKQQHHH